MDASVIELVGSMGFPIVACVAMGWFIQNTFKEFQQIMIENNSLLKNLTRYLMKETDNNDS